MLAISLTEGFSIWDRVDPTMTRHILRPTGPNGEKQEWTLFSLGLEGLVWQFAELDETSGRGCARALGRRTRRAPRVAAATRDPA